MNIEILYMLLPMIFAVYYAEVALTRKSWVRRHGNDALQRSPVLAKSLVAVCRVYDMGFWLLALEEMAIAVLATVVFIYWWQWALLALFYGLAAHLLMHIRQAISLRRYVPGLAVSILSLPYWFVGVANMIMRFSTEVNVVLAVAGIAFVAANQTAMLRLVPRKHE